MKLFYTVLCLLSFIYAPAASPTVPASNLSFNIIEGSFLNIGWRAGDGARRIMIARAGITFNNITVNTFTISCTKGDGARRLIVAREGAPVNALPVDLHSYGANSNFGTGAQVGTGNYAVYGASGNSTVINNLKSGTTYYF